MQARGNVEHQQAVARVLVSPDNDGWLNVEERVLALSPVLAQKCTNYRELHHDVPDIVLEDIPEELILPIIRWLREQRASMDNAEWTEEQERQQRDAFVREHSHHIQAMLLAACRLEIDSLIGACSTYIVDQLRSATPEQVGLYLGIRNDHTEERLRELEEQNKNFIIR